MRDSNAILFSVIAAFQRSGSHLRAVPGTVPSQRYSAAPAALYPIIERPLTVESNGHTQLQLQLQRITVCSNKQCSNVQLSWWQLRIRTHVAVRVPQVVLSQGPQPHTAVAIVALQASFTRQR